MPKEIIAFPHDDTIDTRNLLATLQSDDETFSSEVIEALHEVQGYCPDFRYGETLVAESYFVEYAKQLADDIGAVDDSHGWPTSYIDWQAAADALRQDYTETEIDGVTYLYR